MKRLDVDEESVQRMYREGMTMQEIADYYDVSSSTVRYRLKPELMKKHWKQYQESEQGKGRMKKYRQTENGIERTQEAIRRYAETDKGREAHIKAVKKLIYKRKGLGFIPLNEYFLNSHAHHIDKERVIYIPANVHQNTPHNIWTGKCMEEINAIAFSYINKDKLINEEEKRNEITIGYLAGTVNNRTG